MVEPKGKKAKAKKSSKKEVTVVHFADYVNYLEVAAILSEKVEKLCISSKELAFLAAEGSFNLDAFAGMLEHNIDVDMLNELMGSELGKGILIGLYLADISNASLQEEIEQLESEHG